MGGPRLLFDALSTVDQGTLTADVHLTLGGVVGAV
jgi:hypothetical protein